MFVVVWSVRLGGGEGMGIFSAGVSAFAFTPAAHRRSDIYILYTFYLAVGIRALRF